MRELVKKITVILIIISIFMVTFLISLPVDNNNIYESLLDKHSYIVESEEKNIIMSTKKPLSPIIIFVFLFIHH